MGVGFVGLVIAHIYFALRPEKLWITKAMIFGTISRRNYLEYHDPDRWVAEVSKKECRLRRHAKSSSRRADAIEGGYEMMLAYAAQGLATDQGAANSSQLRDHLQRFDAALTGLAQAYRDCAAALGVGPKDALDGFLKTLEADAATTQAALRLVLGQPGISSQMIDNINASIHVRALLTDVFIVDEIIKSSEGRRGLAVLSLKLKSQARVLKPARPPSSPASGTSASPGRTPAAPSNNSARESTASRPASRDSPPRTPPTSRPDACAWRSAISSRNAQVMVS